MTVAPFVLHYLRRLVKRPGLVLFLTAVPVSLALVEFWAFGPSAGGKPGGAAGAVPVIFVDLDHGVSSRWLASCTTDGFGKEALSVSAIDLMSTARAEFDSGTYAAMIVAPVVFSRSAAALP